MKTTPRARLLALACSIAALGVMPSGALATSKPAMHHGKHCTKHCMKHVMKKKKG